MGKRLFEIGMTITTQIELDDSVFDAVEDGLREKVLTLDTPEGIAGYVGYNMIANDASIASLEGFRPLPEESAVFVGFPDWCVEYCEELEPSQ